MDIIDFVGMKIYNHDLYSTNQITTCFVPCVQRFFLFFFRCLQVNLTLKYFLQYKEFIMKKKQSLLKERLVYSIIFYSTIQTIIVMASYIDFNNHHNENNTENLYEAIMRRHA